MPAIDPLQNFPNHARVLPPENWALVTPDDANDLAYVASCIRCGTAGNVKVTTKGGQTLVIPNMQAGETIVGRFKRIWSTSTTASNLMVGW